MPETSTADIEELFARTRAAVTEQIAEINQTTEQEILALGECIFRIVERSQANIQHTESAMDTVLEAHSTQESALTEYNHQVASFQL